MKKRKKKIKDKNIKTIKPTFNNNLFTEDQKNKIISTVIEYADENPVILNKSFKKFKNEDLKRKIKNNILKTLEKVIISNVPRTTSPDELTSIYLEKYCGHKEKDRNLYIDGYAVQKKTEMDIGSLLELYIQSVLYENDWCCSGTVLEDVDFIRKKNQSWELYQIKNSDNTENKAASKTRDKHLLKGVDIQKWYRRDSIFGLEKYLKEKKIVNSHNWNNFPLNGIQATVSEKGFRNFIKEYFKKITLINES